MKVPVRKYRTYGQPKPYAQFVPLQRKRWRGLETEEKIGLEGRRKSVASLRMFSLLVLSSSDYELFYIDYSIFQCQSSRDRSLSITLPNVPSQHN